MKTKNNGLSIPRYLKGILGALAAVTAALALSCEQPDASPAGAAPAGKGVVALSVSPGRPAGSVLKTVLPAETSEQIGFTKYDLTFTPKGGTALPVETFPADEIGGDSGKTFELALGDWTVEVTAYRTIGEGNDAKYYAAARGKSPEFTVSASEATEVAVTVQPIPVDGPDKTLKGFFTYTVNYPDGATGRLKVTDGEGNLVLGEDNDGDDEDGVELDDKSGTAASVATDTVELAPGYYDLVVRLKNGDGAETGLSRKLHVYAGLYSVATFEFTAGSFADKVYLTAELPLLGTAAIFAAGDVKVYKVAESGPDVDLEIPVADIDLDATDKKTLFVGVSPANIGEKLYIKAAKGTGIITSSQTATMTEGLSEAGADLGESSGPTISGSGATATAKAVADAVNGLAAYTGDVLLGDITITKDTTAGNNTGNNLGEITVKSLKATGTVTIPADTTLSVGYNTDNSVKITNATVSKAAFAAGNAAADPNPAVPPSVTLDADGVIALANGGVVTLTGAGAKLVTNGPESAVATLTGAGTLTASFDKTPVTNKKPTVNIGGAKIAYAKNDDENSGSTAGTLTTASTVTESGTLTLADKTSLLGTVTVAATTPQLVSQIVVNEGATYKDVIGTSSGDYRWPSTTSATPGKATITSTGTSLDTGTGTVTSSSATPPALAKLDSTGSGKLELTGAVTAVTISGGTGNVEFNSAATIAFAGNNSVTAGTIFFKEGFTTPASDATVTLGGDVVVNTAKTIVFGNNDGTLTLAEGATLAIGAVGSATPILKAASELEVDASTTTVLTLTGGNVGVATAGIAFDGDVVFYGDLTLTAVPATFGGTAYFQNTKKITLTDAASIITLTASTGALAQGDPAADVPAAFYQILVGGAGGGTLKPSADTTLTFATGRIVEQSGTTTTHEIELGTKAAVVAGATYKVASETGNVGTLSLASSAVLTLAKGVLDDEDVYNNNAAKLVLSTGSSGTNGAILKNEGKVVAGGTEITGGASSGTWTAGGAAGTVTIEADKITGSTVGVALTAGGDANAAITVEAGETLTVDGVAVTVVTSYGKVVLTGASEGGGSLLLKGGANPGSLVVDSSKSTPVTSITALTIQVASSSANTDAAVTGTVDSGIVVTAASATPTTASLLGSISGGTTAGTNDATISAPSSANDTTIANGAYVKAADE